MRTPGSDTAHATPAYSSRRKKGGPVRRVTGEIHDALTDTADDLEGKLPEGPGYHRAVMLAVVAVGFFLLGVAWCRREPS
jgi:hypothetical protein